MNLKTAFPLSEPVYSRYLLEKDFSLTFSFKHKIYYHTIRPVLPEAMRRFLQKKRASVIDYRKDFIWEDFVNEVGLSRNGQLNDNEQVPLYGKGNECAIVLTHDVEGEEGFKFIPDVIELEEKYGFKSSWNIVPYKYAIDRGIIEEIKKHGHELGIHGYNHDGKLFSSEKIFRQRVPFINRALKEYGAVGFRSPMVHRNLAWLQMLDIEYDASCFDYDPFQPVPGGTGSIWPFVAGKFTELPYTLPQDHTLFYVLDQKDITIWKHKAEWIAKHNGVILTVTHPDYLLSKRRFIMYEELLQFLNNYDRAWHCLPRELARHWKALCGS